LVALGVGLVLPTLWVLIVLGQQNVVGLSHPSDLLASEPRFPAAAQEHGKTVPWVIDEESRRPTSAGGGVNWFVPEQPEAPYQPGQNHVITQRVRRFGSPFSAWWAYHFGHRDKYYPTVSTGRAFSVRADEERVQCLMADRGESQSFCQDWIWTGRYGQFLVEIGLTYYTPDLHGVSVDTLAAVVGAIDAEITAALNATATRPSLRLSCPGV